MCPIEMQNIGNRDIKIVTIGGGTGNSILLSGLKKYSTNITTIVTVADDGGGSGVLREDLGMLPPGDIRACLIALSNTEPAMEKLMQFRFKDGVLAGQSFGNLFLAAMNEIYGSFDEGLKETANVLAITGKVLPMTLEDVVLYARLEDGSVIQGESNITFLTRKYGGRIQEVFIKPELSSPLEEAIDDILDADVIVIGPGSLYTSIMPNLLVKDIAKALIKTDATIYYVANVMTQPGETDGYTITDHVDAIIRHVGENIIDKIFVNNEEIPTIVKYKYLYKENSTPIILKDGEKEKLVQRGYQLIEDNFVDVKHDYVRHDSTRIGQRLIEDIHG